jgi:putative hydrolase
MSSSKKYIFSGYEYGGYRIAYDLHTHTTYSHGIGSIEDNVKAAIAAGLSKIAITDHGPGHLTYGIDRKAVPAMRQDVRAAREKYPDIEILLGVEANLVLPGNHLDIGPYEFSYFDFVIAGYHYGIPKGNCISNWLNHHLAGGYMKKRLLVQNTEMTVAALHENDIKILTHPGDKGPFDMRELARACEETDTLMEVSTWHSHLTLDEIKICKEFDVKFIVSSDAHMPKRVGDAGGAIKRLFEAGVEPERVVNIRKVSEEK